MGHYLTMKFNSEVWHGIKPSDIEPQSIVDHQLLKFIVGVHAKTPSEFLYLETWALPLSKILACRKIIYLKTILKRNKHDLLRRVYEAQKENPTDGDYINLIKKDFETLGQSISEDTIINMTEDTFKNRVKTLVEKAAFEQMNAIKESHSKVRENTYNCLEAQKYILSSHLSYKEKSILLSLRSNTTRGVKNNFSSWYAQNLSCPFSCKNIDDQRHI